jgi:hypothetical protein
MNEKSLKIQQMFFKRSHINIKKKYETTTTKKKPLAHGERFPK